MCRECLRQHGGSSHCPAVYRNLVFDWTVLQSATTLRRYKQKGWVCRIWSLLFAAISRSKLFMVEFMLYLNLTIHCCIAIQIWPCKLKKSILGQCPHIWIISVKEANGFPVLTSNCWQRLIVSYLHRNSHGESYFCNSRDMSVCMLCPLVRTDGSTGP
jgi:hypothetical protein